MTYHTLDDTIALNLAGVRARIEAACARAGRSPAEVRLVAVSKTFGPDEIRAAFAAGQRDFGENKVQEALPKQAALADLPLTWHLVGHLQRNKARRAAGAFSWVHSVDRVELLHALERAAVEQETALELLVQVDLAAEETKHGAPADQVAGLLAAARECRAARVVGLMLLPPLLERPEQVRPYFRAMADLRRGLAAQGAPTDMLRELSMGMSHDFDVAIEEGATIVRLGTAIFGNRPSPGALPPPRSSDAAREQVPAGTLEREPGDRP